MTLREKIDDYFEGFYVQKKIAYTLLKYGLKIKGNKLMRYNDKEKKFKNVFILLPKKDI